MQNTESSRGIQAKQTLFRHSKQLYMNFKKLEHYLNHKERLV